MTLPVTFLHGRRMPFADLPVPIRQWAAGLVGGRIDAVRDAVGGMSVGAAAVVTGPVGRAFVKTSDSVSNPFAHAAYTREAEIAAMLPRHPSIPRLLGRTETDVAGVTWSAAAYEAVDGRPPAHPWSLPDLTRALDAWAEVAPLLRGLESERSVALLSDFLGRWHLIAQDPADPWFPRAHRWLEPCAELATASEGGSDAVFSHIDLRADNILIGERVWFVDWAHPGAAAPWADPLLLVLDAVGSGTAAAPAGDAALRRLWAEHPLTRAFPPDLLPTGAAAMAAALHLKGQRPAPELPHGRVWAEAMSEHLIAFAERWPRDMGRLPAAHGEAALRPSHGAQ